MSKQLYLSLGFDTERPYGPLAETPEGHVMRIRQLSFVRKMNMLLDEENVPRTHFILGMYLESCARHVSGMTLREIYRSENPLLDLQQHSYSHGIYEPLHQVERPVMSPDDYVEDIEHATVLMQEVLGIWPFGLRTPYGYEHDLSNQREILAGLRRIGITYVSSDLGTKVPLEGSLTQQRQPHSYARVGFPGIMELPSHGKQDVIWTPEKAQQLLGKDRPDEPAHIRAHFLGLLDQAQAMNVDRVSVALCLHPWAVMQYDPDLHILLDVVRSARSRGFVVLNYAQLAAAWQ